MQFLSWADLDARAAALDTLAAATPEIDGFCSSSAWILPARLAFAPDAQPAVIETDAGDGFVALMLREMEDGTPWACPLESVWGLACPLIGRDPAPLAAAALALLGHRSPMSPLRPRALILAGIADGGPAARAVMREAAARRLRVGSGPVTQRVATRLDGGLDGFWSRRSAKFRATSRRSQRQAVANGITTHRLTPAMADIEPLWHRILGIEAQSRKAAIGGGLAVPEMQTFYAAMLPRLAAAGTLRVVFVRDGETDIAYVFGGIFADEYRGLQVSFVDTRAAASPGVLAHHAMIEWLCEEGVSTYDLGTDMPYKHRWGEPGLATRLYLVGP